MICNITLLVELPLHFFHPIYPLTSGGVGLSGLNPSVGARASLTSARIKLLPLTRQKLDPAELHTT